MPMAERIFHISHTTTYSFTKLTNGLELTTRLRPPMLASQMPLHTQVLVSPDAERFDVPGNVCFDRFVLRTSTDRLKVTGQTTLAHDPSSTSPSIPPPRGPEPKAEAEARHPLIFAWARETLPDSDLSSDDIQRFTGRLHRDFVFDQSATTRKSGLVDFFTGCRGVCEDYARLATACLRARGVPVRYVVGYLLPSEGRGSSFGRKAHAWISCWVPEGGWIDLDPTTGLRVPDRHVTLIRGFDRDDTQPVSGRVTDGQYFEQEVSVDVSIATA